MLLAQMTVGRRVRIVIEIDIFNLGVYPVGLTGVVSSVDDDDADGICRMVKLDGHRPELNEWDNELQVWANGGDTPDVTPENFEPIA